MGLFEAAGFRRGDYFPHEVVYAAKPYPDMLRVMTGRGVTPEALHSAPFVQLGLYATDTTGFPADLFWDPALNWHRQQLERSGLIAAAGVYRPERSTLFVSLLQADVVQQLFRHPSYRSAYRTRLENRFGGWHRMLLNALLDYAVSTGCEELFVPTVETIVGEIKKQVDPALFRRVYDAPSRYYACEPARVGSADYWRIGVRANQERIASLLPTPLDVPAARGICVCHTLEPERPGRAHLARVLELDRRHRVSSTFLVGPDSFESVRASLLCNGHAVGLAGSAAQTRELDALRPIRRLDPQLKGFSLLRPVGDPTLFNLGFLNFEWVAEPAARVPAEKVRMEQGLVRFPLTDVAALAVEQDDDWVEALVRRARSHALLALELREADSAIWLGRYAELVERLRTAVPLLTLDQAAGRVALADGAELRARLSEVSRPEEPPGPRALQA